MAVVPTRRGLLVRPHRAPVRRWALLRWSAAAGALGGLAGWALSEPLAAGQAAAAGASVYADVFVYFLVVSAALGGVLGALPGLLNRSRRQTVRGALIGAAVGGIGGGVGGLPAQAAFQALGAGLLARAVGWGLVGAAIGVCPGAATRDGRRALRGVIGGAVGGFSGGLLFNLIGMLLPQSAGDTGTANRFIADLVVGLCMGLAVAVVEVAFRTAWLSVTSGKRDGAQFILSKDATLIGCDDRDDVLLWGDPQLASGQARIRGRRGRYTLDSPGDTALTLLNGQPVQGTAPLRDGDELILGQTRLRFHARGRPPAAEAEAEAGLPRPPDARRTVAPAGPLLARLRTPAPPLLPSDTGVSAPTQPGTAGAAGRSAPVPAHARLPLGGEEAVTARQGADDAGVRLVGLAADAGAWSLPRGAVLRLGRGADNDLVVPDETVSAHHAELRWEEGGWVLYDRGSTNGSFVGWSTDPANAQRVGRSVLAAGMILRFGGVTYRLVRA